MTIARFITILRRGWLQVLAGALAGLALAALAVLVTPPKYEARSSAIVTVDKATNVTELRYGQEFSAAQALSYAKLVNSSLLLDRVSAETGYSSAELANEVSAVVEPQTSVIVISAQGNTGDSAARVANSTLGALAEAAKSIDGDNANRVQLVTLNRATASTTPIQPQPRLYAAIGALVGTSVGFTVAALSPTHSSRKERRKGTARQAPIEGSDKEPLPEAARA